MNALRVSSRIFDADDQQAFAALSGDVNPMHMDALRARRTQAGARVVHGMHLFLWALDALARGNAPIGRLVEAKTKFASFVHLDTTVDLCCPKTDEQTMVVELVVGASTVVRSTLRFDRAGKPRGRSLTGGDFPREMLGELPRQLSFEEMQGRKGHLDPPAEALDRAKRMFPALCGALDPAAVCDIALLSSLVGMVDPGMDSIFSDLDLALDFVPSSGTGFDFEAVKADDRFRRVELQAEGPHIVARVTAFARLPPVGTPPMAQIATAVASDEFVGRRALVIGGSRGIGAVTAELIAAGGGSVTLTYASGRADADEVCADIVRSRGPESARAFQYVVNRDANTQLAAMGAGFTHVYYFPTPRIFGPSGALYDRSRLRAFEEAYVDGFYDLTMALLADHRPKDLNLFYPSSSAVSERPKGMTEYSMAKAAGEVLCADLMRAFPGLSVSVARLPRIQTDQTATVPPVPAATSLDVMLPLIRAERRPS